MKRKLTKKDGAVFAVILLLWLTALGVVLYMTLSSPVSGKARRCPVYRVETDEKKIALTFNAAWDDSTTDAVLSLLKAEDVKATFFFVGAFAVNYPETPVKAHNAGHEIGNHSMTHRDLKGAPEETVRRELTECADLLEMLTGVRPVLFRAPSGAWDENTVRLAEEEGMRTVQWSADSIDWKDPSVQTIVSRILKKASPGGILLFHLGKENTLQALPQIIAALKAEGYAFVTVSELIPEGETAVDSEGTLRAVGRPTAPAQ